MIYVIETSTGKIVQRVDAPDGHAQHYERDGCSVVVSDDIIDIAASYVTDSGFVPIPDKPSENHTWDLATHTWIQDRALAEKSVRAKRAMLLAASDWTQLPDVPQETKAEWATNRQALRDITEQADFPFNVIWPPAPQ